MEFKLTVEATVDLDCKTEEEAQKMIDERDDGWLIERLVGFDNIDVVKDW